MKAPRKNEQENVVNYRQAVRKSINKEFQSFELKEIEERSCCLTRISVQVNWKVGVQLHSEALEFGSMYQDETDKFAYPWKNNGTWILYPWDIRGLNA